MTKKNTSGRVSIACKLPHGLIIQIPGKEQTLKLHGALSAYAVAGHGMTQGVTEQEWEAVKTTYAHALWLKNGLVFAQATPESATAKAEERKGKDVTTGFEPIDTNDPSSFPGLSVAND